MQYNYIFDYPVCLCLYFFSFPAREN